MTDTALFEPESLPEALAGVDAAFLADLYDIAAKYGADVGGVEGLRRLTLGGAKTVHVSVTVAPSRQRNILLSPWAGGASVTASHMFMIRDGLASFVLWDRSFAPADVRAGIAALDAEMDGSRDPITRERRRIVSDGRRSAKLKVDEVFAKRGRAISSFHDDDPEALRAQFDRPEDVALVVAPDGRRLLCHRRDARGFAPGRQEEAIRRAIERRGLKDESDLRALSKEELREMYEEINAEVFGDEN